MCTASRTSLCSLCQFLDYQNYIRNCCMKDIPAMERSIALCNGISQWVQLMVLSRPTAQLRAEVFTKFIHVAEVAVGSTPHCRSHAFCVSQTEKRKKAGFFIRALPFYVKEAASFCVLLPSDDSKELFTARNHLTR